jgi:hypothetical protein
MSRSLSTMLAAWAQGAERQGLFEGQTLNVEKSLIGRVGTRRLTFSKREVQDLRPQ